MKMNPRMNVLKQLVTDGHYVIDERMIADAIIVRSMAFRLMRAQHRALHVAANAAKPIA